MLLVLIFIIRPSLILNMSFQNQLKAEDPKSQKDRKTITINLSLPSKSFQTKQQYNLTATSSLLYNLSHHLTL